MTEKSSSQPGSRSTDAAVVPLPERLPYRLLTGPDDTTFCERVSTALADGYRLHGPPAATTAPDGTVVVAQAVVLAAAVDERGELR